MRARLVPRGPAAHHGGEPGLDLIPGEAWIEGLEPAPRLAVPAQPGWLFRPAAAPGRAPPKVVMARKAQHHQVCRVVVAAAKDAEPVVDVELSFGRGNAADLAARASARDQLAPPCRREAGGARAPVVRLAHALTKRRADQKRGKRARSSRGACRAKHVQVRRGGASARFAQEEIEQPRPFQPACLARATAAPHRRPASPRRHVEPAVRTHVRASVTRPRRPVSG